jgi:hypothetical protein
MLVPAITLWHVGGCAYGADVWNLGYERCSIDSSEPFSVGRKIEWKLSQYHCSYHQDKCWSYLCNSFP